MVVGRSSRCEIVLEDDLCSRRHCQFAREGPRILVTDLESRNGVMLNGARLEGPGELHHGDRVTVGQHQLTVLQQQLTPRQGVKRPGEDRGERASTAPSGSTRQASFFEMFLGAARKALDEGELPNAEFAATSLFGTVRSHASRHQGLDPDVIAECTNIAIRLADQMGDAYWLRQGLMLLSAANAPFAPQLASAFIEVARRVGVPDELASYLEAVPESSESLSELLTDA